MMYLKQLFLGIVGLCAGGVIAAGIFAFIVTIGVVARLIGKTHTAKHTRLIEDFIVVGGTLGNVMNLYQISIPGGYPLLILFGGGSGWPRGSSISYWPSRPERGSERPSIFSGISRDRHPMKQNRGGNHRGAENQWNPDGTEAGRAGYGRQRI